MGGGKYDLLLGSRAELVLTLVARHKQNLERFPCTIHGGIGKQAYDPVLEGKLKLHGVYT